MSPRWILAGLAFLVAACASTRLTSVQVAPEPEPREKLHNVLVVGLVKDPATRQSFETNMEKALRAAGVQAQSSQALLPIGEAPTREALERLVAEKGFDSAVVGQLVDARTEVRAAPPAGVGFYGFAGWAAPMAWSPGYLEATTTVVLETRVFRTAGESAPVFQATSSSVDPASARNVTEQLAGLVVEQLRKNGFI